MLTLLVASSTKSSSATHPANKTKALRSVLTVTAKINQVQQLSKHHEKQIHRDERKWSEVTKKAWKKGAEYKEESICLEMVSTH